MRVVLAEDLFLLRDRLVRLLEAFDFTIVAAVDNGPSLVRALVNEKPLIAITTVAPRRRAEAGQPWVVLLNAGIIHRIGPNRLYVQLARRLASRGHAVLRFDLAGIGDSEPPST